MKPPFPPFTLFPKVTLKVWQTLLPILLMGFQHRKHVWLIVWPLHVSWIELHFTAISLVVGQSICVLLPCDNLSITFKFQLQSLLGWYLQLYLCTSHQNKTQDPVRFLSSLSATLVFTLELSYALQEDPWSSSLIIRSCLSVWRLSRITAKITCQ